VITIGLAALAVWQAWPRPTYTFTVPSPDEITTEPCAFRAIVQGKPPTGQIIVVSNQDQDIGDNSDPLLHFGPATQWPNTDKWYAHVQIGDPETKAGTPYTLTAWLMDADTVASLTRTAHHDWWDDKHAPNGSKQVATVSVTRKDVAIANCWK